MIWQVDVWPFSYLPLPLVGFPEIFFYMACSLTFHFLRSYAPCISFNFFSLLPTSITFIYFALSGTATSVMKIIRGTSKTSSTQFEGTLSYYLNFVLPVHNKFMPLVTWIWIFIPYFNFSRTILSSIYCMHFSVFAVIYFIIHRCNLYIWHSVFNFILISCISIILADHLLLFYI